MKILYFASVRQALGKSEENLPLPDGIGDVAGLMAHLQTLGAGYSAVFGAPEKLCAAVNQTHAGFHAPVSDGDEVAFFPPVTGG